MEGKKVEAIFQAPDVFIGGDPTSSGRYPERYYISYKPPILLSGAILHSSLFLHLLVGFLNLLELGLGEGDKLFR
jgi:hypothetical protein